MLTKFDIIEKRKIDSDGDEYSRFFIKKTYFGFISLYIWSFEEIMESFSNFLSTVFLFFVNIIFYIIVAEYNILYCILISMISIYIVYALGRKKFKYLNKAEEHIKKIIKKKKFKVASEKVVSYEIDTKNGIIRKEVNQDN